MSKIANDKYYTPTEVSKRLIDKTFEIIGKDNISEIIEPSAGDGSFSDQMVCEAYDILPEGDNIIEQDYLELKKEYKKGRLIIGNPPFGHRNNLVIKFFNKSVELGDYIAFILPISQLNNSYSLYKFDLIYSEDLGLVYYTDRDLKCCFNIYRRPNILNKKPKIKSEYFKIYESIKKKSLNIDDYDIGICGWGIGIIGNVITKNDEYSNIFYFKIYKYKKEIIKFIKKYDWNEYVKSYSISGQGSLQMWRVYQLINEHINTLELNKRVVYVPKDYKITKYTRGERSNYTPFNIDDYDISICDWGESIGKIVTRNDQYTGIFHFKIFKYKKEIIEFIKNYDWLTEMKKVNIGTPSIVMWRLNDLLRKNIDGLE